MAFPQHTGRPLDETNMRNNCLRLARALQAHGVSLQGVAAAAGPAAGPRDGGSEGVAKTVAEGLLRLDQRITLGVLWQMAMHFKVRACQAGLGSRRRGTRAGGAGRLICRLPLHRRERA